MSRVMKTFALQKSTEQLRYRAGWSSPLSFDVYIQYMLPCFFLVFIRQNMLKILMLIMPPTLKKLMGHIAFGASGVRGCVGGSHFLYPL